MSNQPEALRLADLLQDRWGVDGYVRDEAAAELRRLHALLEAEQALHQRTTYPELRRLHAENEAIRQAITDPENQPSQFGTVTLTMYEALEAQRDALLEALKLARSIIGHPDDAHTQMIDAAIKAVEGEKT